jgi:L,D-peptidoglycan transpeptidase YkuD (ErfK/YbiS/YcfS/YnhG family)
MGKIKYSILFIIMFEFWNIGIGYSQNTEILVVNHKDSVMIKLKQELKLFLKENPGLLDITTKLDGSEMIISADSLNIREYPLLDSPIVFKIYKGMDIKPVEKKEVDGQVWLKIRIRWDNEFWIDATIENFSPNKENKISQGYKIMIMKNERKLYLQKGNGKEWITQKTYPISLGKSGNCQNKANQGDNCTPSGMYYAIAIINQSQFGKDPETGEPLASIQISYPNQFDAWRTLQQGFITNLQYTEICDADLAKKMTPQNTMLGNHIMIHGGGHTEMDWTWGCIALEDKDMKELLEYVKYCMPIEIKY